MPCSLTLDRITTRRRRRLLRTASLVLAVALLAPGFATADPETPPLPARYSQSACHALVRDAVPEFAAMPVIDADPDV